MDRQVLTAPDASTRCMDGFVAGVVHLRTSDRTRNFSIRRKLTTLMLFVASDLSEAQRERLTSSLSLQGVTVTAYTFEAVRTVFVEFVCTPKC